MRLPTVLLTVLVAFLSFVGVAHAADGVDPEGGGTVLVDLARPVLDAVMHGQGWLAAALALVFVVAFVGKYSDKIPTRAGRRIEKLAGTDHGRAVLVLLGSFGGAVATALTAAGPGAMSWALAWTALKVAVGAAGVFSLAKKLLTPLVDKAPTWLRPVLRLALWAMDAKARKSESAVKQAEAAGDAAVKANPPKGTAGIVGNPRDVK